MSLNDGTPQVSHTQNDLLLVTETTADAGISRHLTILDDYHHPTMLGDVYFALNQRLYNLETFTSWCLFTNHQENAVLSVDICPLNNIYLTNNRAL